MMEPVPHLMRECMPNLYSVTGEVGYQLENRSFSNTNQRYKFTGKEKDKDLENNYDYFGARYYDSRIANWTSLDPLFEKHMDLSPYNYVLRCPLVFFDPDGKQVNSNEKTLYTELMVQPVPFNPWTVFRKLIFDTQELNPKIPEAERGINEKETQIYKKGTEEIHKDQFNIWKKVLKDAHKKEVQNSTETKQDEDNKPQKDKTNKADNTKVEGKQYYPDPKN